MEHLRPADPLLVAAKQWRTIIWPRARERRQSSAVSMNRAGAPVRAAARCDCGRHCRCRCRCGQGESGAAPAAPSAPLAVRVIVARCRSAGETRTAPTARQRSRWRADCRISGRALAYNHVASHVTAFVRPPAHHRAGAQTQPANPRPKWLPISA